MEQKINRVLLPDIKYSDESGEYTFSYNGGASPLEQALNSTDKSLFLVAMGGQGKTTTLRTLWLDSLRGKSNITCIYVDCKLLKAEEQAKAITKFIEKEYKLDIAKSKFNIKPIILLDGANEAHYSFRDDSHDECLLTQECKRLICDGFRLIVSSRSMQIGMGIRSEENNNLCEFSHDDMQYCKLCELTTEQIKSTLLNVEDDTPLHNLLKNNMMLMMYSGLKHCGEEIDKERITAGELLKKYFDKCFKVKYIAASVPSIELKDSELFDKIVEIETRKRHNKNIVFQFDEEKIAESLDKFDLTDKFLTANATSRVFSEKEVKENNYLTTLEHLSVLYKTPDNEYIWANEIYQEYFEAKNIFRLICAIRDDPSDKNVGLYLHAVKKLPFSTSKRRLSQYFRSSIVKALNICVDDNTSYYIILQYAAELCKIEELNFSGLNSCIIKCLNGLYSDSLWRLFNANASCLAKNTIIVMSVFAGQGIPDKTIKLNDDIFYGCKRLKEITIPLGVESIGDNAFYGCTALEDVIISPSVKSLGAYAFASCEALTRINIPESVKTIGDNAFIDCNSLTEVTAPNVYGTPLNDSIKKLKLLKGNKEFSKGFRNGRSLIDVEIADGVESLGDYAFYSCVHLSRVQLPSTLRKIGEYAFYGCARLNHIEFPPTLKKIGTFAFDGSGLQDVTIPQSLEIIDPLMFMHCGKLACLSVEERNKSYHSVDNCIIETKSKTLVVGCKNSIIPADGSVTAIGEDAFCDCVDLVRIDIPDAVLSISNEAFFNCENLKEIILGKGILYIGHAAFNFGPMRNSDRVYCEEFDWSSIYYKGTVEEWGRINICENNRVIENCQVYFYSENRPIVKGKFWHYINGKIVVWDK